MSWIHKHWEEHYITDAETKIRETVSLFSWTMLREAGFPHRSPFQMLQYRQKISIASKAAVPEPDLGVLPAYMSLAAQYGLEDMTIGASDTQERSIEQEYQAYITASLSPTNIDILKFWEVGVSNGISVSSNTKVTL